MKTIRFIFLGLALGFGWISKAQVFVKVKPIVPVNAIVIAPGRTSHGKIWTGGNWVVKGNTYIWTNGCYTTTRHGYSYINGHWRHQRRGWVWIPGQWKRIR